MAQGTAKKTVLVGGQPVSIEDLDQKDVLVAILELLQDVKDLLELSLNGVGS